MPGRFDRPDGALQCRMISVIPVTVLAVLVFVALAAMALGVMALRGARQRGDAAPDLRAEFDRIRAESQAAARELRGELSESVTRMSAQVSSQMTQIATVQNNQIDTFSRQLNELTAANERRLQELRATVDAKLGEAKEDARLGREESALTLRRFADTLNQQLVTVQQASDQRLAEMRQIVESRLESIQKDNGEKLERMRQTVDEKLHATLEQRLGESFKTVRDQLDKVHLGLGEMQSLATDVGGLKRVLTNVKERGTWGEYQLGAILEQILTPEQFGRNVHVKDDGEVVEFAVRLPGRDVGEGKPVWLPIDSKFPKEDYERLVVAAGAADKDGVEQAVGGLLSRVESMARDIQKKYIAGPTTLSAILNSLRVGFQTLAIEKRAHEVWTVLGAVKTEFGNFGHVLEKVKRQLATASNTIDESAVRTRAMARRLKSVEQLPVAEAEAVLGLSPAGEEEELRAES